jgi:hypothetical protein
MMKMFEAAINLPLAEQALDEAWNAILGSVDPDETADFFKLGGTSLAAIRLEAALFEKGWLLSAGDILQNPEKNALPALMTPAGDTDWEAGE